MTRPSGKGTRRCRARLAAALHRGSFMGKKKSPARKSRSPRPHDADQPAAPEEPAREAPSDEVHDAGRPGGLPELEKKTDTEGEHDSWWRHG
jgi:hypothetical protein